MELPRFRIRIEFIKPELILPFEEGLSSQKPAQELDFSDRSYFSWRI